MEVGDIAQPLHADARIEFGAGIVISIEPFEDPQLGLLSSVDTVCLRFRDGETQSFWSTDLELVSEGRGQESDSIPRQSPEQKGEELAEAAVDWLNGWFRKNTRG